MALRPFHEIAVAEIAQEADASVSSIYARFPNKEALLGAIYERYSNTQRKMIDELLSPAQWQGVSLAQTLRATFPIIVAGYQARQGLLRAFLEQASRDIRFRQTWSIVGDHIIARVTELVMSRLDEVNHPEPERGIRLGLRMVFATLAHQMQMHEIDDPEMDVLTEELIIVMLRHMGIPDESQQSA